MLFWILIGLLILGFLLFKKYGGKEWEVNVRSVLGMILIIVCAIGVVVSVCIISDNHIHADGRVAHCKARYESLVYQYENDIYENDNDLGKRDLMVDIESWNTDLAYKKEIQDNFWIGIYYPNIYDQFEFIPLEK